jgi:hypothetical protein
MNDAFLLNFLLEVSTLQGYTSQCNDELRNDQYHSRKERVIWGALIVFREKEKRRHRQKNNCSSGGRKATILLAGRHSGPSNHPRPALWLGLSSPLNQYR